MFGIIWTMIDSHLSNNKELSYYYKPALDFYTKNQFSLALAILNKKKGKLSESQIDFYSEFILLRALCYFKLSQIDQAINDISLLILSEKSNETKAWGLMVRSRYFLDKKLFDAAIHNAKEGKKLTIDFAIQCELYQTLALAHCHLGNFEKAKMNYIWAMSKRPSHPSSFNVRMIIELKKENKQLSNLSIEKLQDPLKLSNIFL